MPLSHQETMDTMELVRKRLEVLVGARVKQKGRMTKAIKLQDELCTKYSNISEARNGTDEIRKWRDIRK